MSQHIELGRIATFIEATLIDIPAEHGDRPYIESLLGSVNSRLDSLLGAWRFPRTHKEYLTRLERFSDMMNGNSPQAKEFQLRREHELEDQRLQGMLPETFGERLGFHRRRLGISQRDLAKLANLHPSEINRFERNKRKPSTEAIELFAKKLLLPPSYTAELVQLVGNSTSVNPRGLVA